MASPASTRPVPPSGRGFRGVTTMSQTPDKQTFRAHVTKTGMVLRTPELAADEDVRVLCVRVSANTYGAVDADLIVRVGAKVVEAEVTLCPDPGRPTRRRRHPLSTWGDLDMWASDNLVSAIRDAEAKRDAAIEADSDEPIVDFDVSDLASEIECAVDEAAEENGL